MAQEKPIVNIGSDRESLISIVLGAIVVIIIGALAFRYFRNRDAIPANGQNQTQTETTPNVVEVQELPSEVRLEQNDQGQSVPAGLPAKYTVKAGDSTWKVAQAFYGSGFNYVDIEQANNLAPDTELTVGQELTIPRVAVRNSDSAGMNTNNVQATESPMPKTQPTGPTKGDDKAAQEAVK